MMFQKLLFVFLGGGLGSVLRFLISKHFNTVFENFYLGTFLVNIFGCLLIGIFVGMELKYLLSKPNLLLLVTGFCGGFTTFSAFAMENYNFLKSEHYFSLLLYILLSIVLGILAVALGIFIVKQLFN